MLLLSFKKLPKGTQSCEKYLKFPDIELLLVGFQDKFKVVSFVLWGSAHFHCQTFFSKIKNCEFINYTICKNCINHFLPIFQFFN